LAKIKIVEERSAHVPDYLFCSFCVCVVFFSSPAFSRSCYFFSHLFGGEILGNQKGLNGKGVRVWVEGKSRKSGHVCAHLLFHCVTCWRLNTQTPFSSFQLFNTYHSTAMTGLRELTVRASWLGLALDLVGLHARGEKANVDGLTSAHVGHRSGRITTAGETHRPFAILVADECLRFGGEGW